MNGRGIKDTIQVEWFNVTYRSVTMSLLLLVLAAVGGAAWWYYAANYAPRAAAEAAIDRAESRLGEASVLTGDARLREIVDSAGVALEEARSEFGSTEFNHARVAAMRSENLSLKAIALAGGGEQGHDLVRFYRIEGDVRVKKAGEFSWDAANAKMVLQIGDQVKTSSSASAKLIYFDGTVTTIAPASLLEIRDLYEDPVTMVRRVKEKLNWGELHASTQKRNVNGSYHEVATERVSARAEDAGEFRVSFDRQRQTAEFDVFGGKVQIEAADKKESLVQGERLRAAADGRLQAKETLPGIPRLLAPSDQRVFLFEDPGVENISLSWETVPRAARYELVISDKALFTQRLYDAQRAGTSAVVEGVPAGSYYWKVAAVAESGAVGPYSQPRRFRVSSQQIKDRTDKVPPDLEIADFVAIGSMVIVNGRTEPGASLWVDDEKIDVDDQGTFYAVVRLRREGLNELRFVAQDTAGNETAATRSAYFEPY